MSKPFTPEELMILAERDASDAAEEVYLQCLSQGGIGGRWDEPAEDEWDDTELAPPEPKSTGRCDG